MKGKRIFYSERVYFVGIVVLAFSTALMERANLGLSMVVAPAYLVHLKLVEYLQELKLMNIKQNVVDIHIVGQEMLLLLLERLI